MDRRVSLERGAGALEKLVPQWEELAAQALEPNPFYEHWMLRPALELPGGGEAELACVWRGATLELLLPVQRLPRYKGLPVRALCAWRHKHCLLGTPLVRAGCAVDALAALLAWMRKERGASVLELNYLTAGAPFHQALVEALAKCGMPSLAVDAYTRPMLRRDRDAESYIGSSLSGESRSKLRRGERRLREQGALERRVLRPGDDVGKWIDELLCLEAAGWKGRRGSALGCSEANRRFAVEVFTRAFERGRLLMVGLDLEGRPIARYTAFVAGEGAFAFKTAYDEQFRKGSPGILAELDMIGAFHERAELQWMDSFTAPGNGTLAWVWKHRCIVQRIAVGVGTAGELALAALPLLQWLKHWGQSICSVPKLVILPGRPQPAK
ncbi:MAG: hypothetical protein A3G81_25850 [Betaproteobacteria bacterium RIFCSPLOWO2_12_FULL_65_14]|nr:MAG: hypothetical protein A3G81_25850 [Betaproteobacteria bacterium RIFCSPLOWO2_12_FULL_65_14]